MLASWLWTFRAMCRHVWACVVRFLQRRHIGIAQDTYRRGTPCNTPPSGSGMLGPVSASCGISRLSSVRSPRHCRLPPRTPPTQLSKLSEDHITRARLRSLPGTIADWYMYVRSRLRRPTRPHIPTNDLCVWSMPVRGSPAVSHARVPSPLYMVSASFSPVRYM